MPAPPGIGRQAVDVVEGQPRVGDGGEAGVDGERQRVDHQAAADGRAADTGEHRTMLEPVGADRSAGRRPGRLSRPDRQDRWSPVGSNSGSQTSSWCSKRTATRCPTWTSYGSHPTMLVVRCTLGSSSSATLAIAYGGSNAGCHWCWFTVKPTTVPRPDTTVGACAGSGTTGTRGPADARAGRSRRSPGSAALPSSPDVQNQSLAGVSCGSGRTVTGFRCCAGTRWPPLRAGTSR